jgi:hypothetical protein
MKIENQVIPLQQAKRLKEIGVDGSFYCWVYPTNERMISTRKGVCEAGWAKQIIEENEGDEFDHDMAPAFTVSELAAMIGKGTNAAALLYDAVLDQMNRSHSFTICYSPEFLANCIIGMLETGRLTPAEVNQRLLNA